MSRRHTKPCRLKRHTRLGGGIAGVAAIGATVICLISAGPAQSSQKVNLASAGALAAAPRAAVSSNGSHRLAALPPITGKGAKSARKDDRALMPTASDALKLATSQVGVAGDESGGGTKFQKWFVSSPWAVRGVERDGGVISDYADANWCDMFVSWVGAQLGVKGMGADAYTRTHAQWFKDQGRWGQTATPGAVVFFSWSGSKSIDDIDHVGMVINDNHDGTIQTVEGNTENAVKIRTRDVSNVVGYGYPQYGAKGA